MPDDEIRKHDDWYLKYMELKNNRKKAIENWKLSRTQ